MATVNLGRVKGDPFTWDDFTTEQLEQLKGTPGTQGPPGRDGPTGPTMPISDSVISPDSGVAASSLAVKTAYDRASSPASTAVAGVVRLVDSVTSISTTDAATPNSVAAAYSMAMSRAPVPMVTAGAGQWVALQGPNEVQRLPTGGTWAYFFIEHYTPGGGDMQMTTRSGVAAGGTYIGPSAWSIQGTGFAWRIA